MLSTTSLAAFVILASSVLAAPADSCSQDPTIKAQVTAHGKQYYYRGCYDELKREWFSRVGHMLLLTFHSRLKSSQP